MPDKIPPPDLNREDRIRWIAEQISIEETVERLKEEVKTDYDVDDLRRELAKLDKEMSKLRGDLKSRESEAFHEIKDKLDGAVKRMTSLMEEKSQAITDKYKIGLKFDDEIQKTEMRLKDLREKRARGLKDTEDLINRLDGEKPRVKETLDRIVGEFKAFCGIESIDPEPYLSEVYDLEPPSVTIDRSAVTVVMRIPDFPTSWFNPEISMKWAAWKVWLSKRGVVVIADRSSYKAFDEINGEQMREALKLCSKRFSKDCLE